MNAEKLLPCPWCKGIPKVGVTEKTSPRDEDSGHAYVACCDTYINRQTEAEAITAWNARPAPTEAEVEAAARRIVAAEDLYYGEWKAMNEQIKSLYLRLARAALGVSDA